MIESVAFLLCASLKQSSFREPGDGSTAIIGYKTSHQQPSYHSRNVLATYFSKNVVNLAIVTLRSGKEKHQQDSRQREKSKCK